MESQARVVRDRCGRELVLVDLAEFEALVDAAAAAEHGLPDTARVVDHLKRVLREKSDDAVDLEDFLADYDAAQGAT